MSKLQARRHAAGRLAAIAVYAVAMAYLEAAVVVYLRGLIGSNDPLSPATLPDQYTAVEIGREAATLVMLAAIGWVAGRGWQDRVGYSIVAFGVWDIFYYVWLAVLVAWPQTLLDWDLLFLIPLPWWGPVLSPVLVSLLLIAAGSLAVVTAAQGQRVRLGLVEWGVAGACVLLALYAFMADALRALPGGIEAVAAVRPATFNWLLFLAACLGMAGLLVRVFSSAVRQASRAESVRKNGRR